MLDLKGQVKLRTFRQELDSGLENKTGEELQFTVQNMREAANAVEQIRHNPIRDELFW